MTGLTDGLDEAGREEEVSRVMCFFEGPKGHKIQVQSENFDFKNQVISGHPVQLLI